MLEERLDNVVKTTTYQKSILFRQTTNSEHVKCGVLLEESRYNYSLRKWIAPKIMSPYSNRRMFNIEYFLKRNGEQCEIKWQKDSDSISHDVFQKLDLKDFNQMAHVNLQSYEDMLNFFTTNNAWILNPLSNIDLALISYSLGDYKTYEGLLMSLMPDIHSKSPLFTECQNLLKWYENRHYYLIDAYIEECIEASKSAFNRF
jgi:hypothetical protein